MLRWGEAVACSLIILFAIIVRGWFLAGAVITLVVVGLFKYISWSGQVATHHLQERLRLQGNLLPNPLEHRPYVYRSLVF